MEKNKPKKRRKTKIVKNPNPKRKSFIQLYHPSANALSKNTLIQFRHHLIPGLTLNKHIEGLDTAQDFVNFYKRPPISFTSPTPFLAPNEITEYVLKGEDPAKELVRKAFNWKLKKRVLLQTARNSCKRNPIVSLFVKESRFEQAHQREQPLGIANLAFHLSQNPDPNFKGFYNWYYGNTACVAQFRGEDYLLCARGKGLEELGMFNLGSGVAGVAIDLNNTSGPILDVSFTGDSNLVAVRQKNSCSFFELEKEDDFSVKNLFKIIGDKTPFTSLAFKRKQFCTVNTGRTIRLWDVETASCVTKGRLLDQGIYLSNKWMSAKFHQLDDNLIAMVDRTTMYWVDKRIKLSKPTYQYQVNNKAEICEEISLLLPTTNTNRWYVALNHTFLTFDARNSEAIQKWTHMMDSQPSVGHVANISSMTNSSSEMILLGTQATGYTVAIFNDIPSADHFTSRVLPFCVPNRSHAIKRARFNGLFTHRMFDEIIASSLTGLMTHQRDGKFLMYTADTTGNVYSQEALLPENFPENETSRLRKEQLMEEWEGNLCAKWRSADMEVRVTEMWDMSEVMEDIRNKGGGAGTDEADMNVEGDRRWRISKAEVESYVDVLAPVVADHYEIYDDDEWLEEVEDEEEGEIDNPPIKTERDERLDNREKKKERPEKKKEKRAYKKKKLENQENQKENQENQKENQENQKENQEKIKENQQKLRENLELKKESQEKRKGNSEVKKEIIEKLKENRGKMRENLEMKKENLEKRKHRTYTDSSEDSDSSGSAISAKNYTPKEPCEVYCNSLVKNEVSNMRPLSDTNVNGVSNSSEETPKVFENERPCKKRKIIAD